MCAKDFSQNEGSTPSLLIINSEYGSFKMRFSMQPEFPFIFKKIIFVCCYPTWGMELKQTKAQTTEPEQINRHFYSNHLSLKVTWGCHWIFIMLWTHRPQQILFIWNTTQRSWMCRSIQNIQQHFILDSRTVWISLWNCVDVVLFRLARLFFFFFLRAVCSYF